MAKKSLKKTWTDYVEGNDPVELAGVVGKKAYFILGKLTFPELEVSYLLASLKRRHYTNNAYARLVRNIYLDWKRGWYKSSMMLWFLRRCIGANDINYMSRWTEKERKGALYDPHFLKLTSGISKAKLRGSITDDGHVVYPLIQKPWFLIAGELLEFLGESNEITNYMLDVAEEGTGSASLVKMAWKKLDKSEKKECRRRNITYDDKEGTMNYPIKGTVWAGTRPLKDKKHEVLKSGLLDRFIPVVWRPEQVEYRKQWFSDPATKVKESSNLKKINIYYWTVKIQEVNVPPRKYVRELKVKLINKLDKKAISTGFNDNWLSGRDGINLKQLLTVSALIRQVSKYSDTEIEKLEYDKKDVIWCEPFLDKIVKNTTLIYGFPKVLDKAHRIFNKFKKKGGRKWSTDKWIKFCKKEGNVKESQAHEYLNMIEGKGLIKRNRKEGTFKLSKKD